MVDVPFERLAIPTASPMLLRDVEPGRTTTALSARYYPPVAADPPYPAAVVSTAPGAGDGAHAHRYGRLLAQNGCAALLIDSAGARGLGGATTPLRALKLTEATMLSDAFASLATLAARPDVDAGRIIHLGFGEGGMIATLTAYAQIRHLFAAGQQQFAAHVSYYGPTAMRLVDYRTTGAPVVMLNGSLDDGLDVKRLALIEGDLRNGGAAVENVLFDATREWDEVAPSRGGRRLALTHQRMRIEPDHTIVDETSGRRVAGTASRLAMVLRATRLAARRQQPDPQTTRQSDEILLSHASGRASLAPEAPRMA